MATAKSKETNGKRQLSTGNVPTVTGMDSFARATAKRAHRTSSEALLTAQAALEIAEKTHALANVRSRAFAGLCALCGEPCSPKRRYCTAHEWASA